MSMPMLFTGLSNYLPAIVLAASALLSGPVSAGAVQDALLKDSDNVAGGEYVRSRYLKLVKQPFDRSDSRKKALIIGDSHGQDFLNALLENNALANYQIRTRYIPNICQIYLGDEDVSSFIEARNAPLCAESDTLQQARTQIAEADLVILVASWKTWSAERLATTLKNLQLADTQTLRVIGRKSFGKIEARKYLRLPDSQLTELRNSVDAHQQAVNQILHTTLDPAIYVDLQQLICAAEDTCPVFTDKLRLISFDGGHLTQDGARYVGERLLQSEWFKGL